MNNLVQVLISKRLGCGPQERHDLCYLFPINILISTEDISPDGACKHGVALDESLVVGRKTATPLQKQILQILVANASRGHVVQQHHLVLGRVGEMLVQVPLIVAARSCGLEVSET